MDPAKYHSEVKEIWQSGVLQDLFPGNLIVELGSCFLKTPYRSGTLETPGREKLVMNLNEFDCTTFVETVLALAVHCDEGDLSPSRFGRHLKLIRYRGGKIEGYASRLHYFTDWLRDNQKKKILTDATFRLGGKPVRKKINYMTMHRELYPALKNKKAYEKMLQVEKSLSRRIFNVIDPRRISAAEKKIQNGDIVAFTTDEAGLDVSHTGFAARRGKILCLLHASSKEGAVVLSRKSLADYVKSNPKINGIIVARAVAGG